MKYGKKEQSEKYEGASWNEVYFETEGCYFTASMPNYLNGSWENQNIKLIGHAGEGTGYLIQISINGNYLPPKSAEEFTKLVQKANPDCIVYTVDPKAFGAKYVVDIVPTVEGDDVFERLLCTKDRVIIMDAIDSNENRRLNFFDSIYIQ